MKQTEYIYDDKIMGYEFEKDGYSIFLGDQLWIRQSAYIPYKKKTMEESAIAHIKALYEEHQQELESVNTQSEIVELQQLVTDMDLRILELESGSNE